MKAASRTAPLGRAVIGGLSAATVATLIFVPCVFALLHGRSSKNDQVDETELHAIDPVHYLAAGD